VRARDRVLSDDEPARAIVRAREIGGPHGGIVEILPLTGRRREEVAECPWDELDLDGQIWALPKSRTKNEKAHLVHLSHQSVAILKRMRKEKKEPFVFSVYGTKPHQGFSEAKRELNKISGVKDWRLHDLRRTCVSGIARLGVPPRVSQIRPQSPRRHDFGGRWRGVPTS
jgi:integrase